MDSLEEACKGFALLGGKAGEHGVLLLVADVVPGGKGAVAGCRELHGLGAAVFSARGAYEPRLAEKVEHARYRGVVHLEERGHLVLGARAVDGQVGEKLGLAGAEAQPCHAWSQVVRLRVIRAVEQHVHVLEGASLLLHGCHLQ